MNDAATVMRGVVDAARPVARASPRPRYVLQSAEDLRKALPVSWLVRGVLPGDSFAALFGPSGSGKSFLALDMCIAVACGKEWFGRKVTAAPVVYICLEGEHGMVKRLEAVRTHRGQSLPANLRFIAQPFDLRFSDDVSDLADAVLANGSQRGLLVLDTLNRAAPGADENSPKDMGQLIRACEELRQRTGWAVLLVHHTGKDSTKGLRGHSSLFAALDSAIEVSRSGDHREWSIAKSKDDADGEQHAFELRVIDLGEDEDGELVTSCVIESHAPLSKSRHREKLSGGTKIGLSALDEVISAKGRSMAGSSSIPKGALVVEESEWRRQFYVRYGSDEDTAATKSKAFRRAKEVLIAAELVMMSAPFAWRTGK